MQGGGTLEGFKYNVPTSSDSISEGDLKQKSNRDMKGHRKNNPGHMVSPDPSLVSDLCLLASR